MVDKLTPMESSCVRLTMEGLPNGEIAARLGISVNTVKGHLARAYDRLGLAHHSSPRTRAAVMMAASDMGTHAGRLLRMGDGDGTHGL